MNDDDIRQLQASYDRVAHEYAERIFDELKHKPLDCRLLEMFAGRVRPLGTACDLGCGPGQVARYLRERGVPVVGIDLSAEMVACARRLNPAIEFRQGNMMALDFPDATLGGIAAFYSIVHVDRAEMPTALGEMMRVLRPGGLLLLAFHIGDHIEHRDEWWGQPVCVDFVFFQPDEVAAFLRAAGFTVEAIFERAPYPEIEHQTRRAYVLASRPAQGLAEATGAGPAAAPAQGGS